MQIIYHSQSLGGASQRSKSCAVLTTHDTSPATADKLINQINTVIARCVILKYAKAPNEAVVSTATYGTLE